MKKLFIICMSILIMFTITSCNQNNQLNSQGVIKLVQTDMYNISNTIRNLDNLFIEDYTINEISPNLNYNNYNNLDYNTNFNDEITAVVSAPALNQNQILNYSYSPKYIANINSLNSTKLIAYLQSIQDLFLITSDITAANQILNELTYTIINKTINVRNNAYLINYNINELTQEEIATIQEYSVNLNNILNNIKQTNGYINNEINGISNLKTTYYKNAETLNAKYLNVMNILDTRITQFNNIMDTLNRLDNQINIMTDVEIYRNNNTNNYQDNVFNNYNNTPNIDNINSNENCHNCKICPICGNCVDCDECEICPKCGRPSICNGNCETNQNNKFNNNINTATNNGINNGLPVNTPIINNELNKNEVIDNNSIINNIPNNQITNNDTNNNIVENKVNESNEPYQNYNGTNFNTPIIKDNTELNYESHKIYE